jgi:TPR repeat protein
LLAEEGNADAQYQLGSFYEYGINGAEKTIICQIIGTVKPRPLFIY